MENLRKFRTRDVVQRLQTFGSAVDVICADHCADVWQRPIRNLAAVGECGQVRFRVCVIVQLQRTGHNGHCFLPRDGRIRGHCRVRSAVVCSHLHRHGHIFKIPFVFGNVLVLGNVGFHVAAERAVDDRRHLRTSHIAVWVDDGRALAIQQAVVHGGADRFCVPCGFIEIAEICGFAVDRVCRRRADGQGKARCNGENHCEDSFVFHLTSSIS